MFLDLERKRLQKLLVGFVVVLIGIPFAFFGIEQYFQYTADTSVARVGDVAIEAEDLRRALQQERQRLREMLGVEALRALDERALQRQVLEGLIRRALLVQAAYGWGLSVEPVRVGLAIRQLPVLQDAEGRFDPERYRRLLAAQGLSVSQFEAGVREDLLVDQIRRGVGGTAFVTAPELDLWIRIQGERREVGYLLLPLERFTTGWEPDEEALRAYYEAHRDEFLRPEQVSIRYVELSVEDLAREEQVTEEELRTYYEEHAADYQAPEQRRARHILIRVAPEAPEEEVAEARARAEALLEEIRGGADFAELARRHSQDPGSARQGGDLGFFGPGVMDPAFERAVFALKEPGEVAGPVRTPFGFHLVQLVEVRPGETRPFEAVREEIAQRLRREKAARRFFDLSEQLANLSFENPGSLEPAAEALGLEIREAGPFTREAGEGIAARPEVRRAAFDPEVLEGGNNSDPVELAPDHWVVLRVKEHRPAAPRPLEEVRRELDTTPIRGMELDEMDGGRPWLVVLPIVAAAAVILAVVLGSGDEPPAESPATTGATTRVDSDPPGATITLDGRPLGVAPLDVAAPVDDAVHRLCAELASARQCLNLDAARFRRGPIELKVDGDPLQPAAPTAP